MGERIKNLLESLLVFAVITGLLLPVRLLFVTYISDNWFGSFGIISVISISLIILTKKEKLGKFGRIFDKQINKLHQGRNAKIVYVQGIFFLTILGGTIFAIEFGNSHYFDLKNELLDANEELKDPNHLISQAENVSAQEFFVSLSALMISFFIAFPKVSVIFAILNDTFDGWILHFYTVAFVEYLELFGILFIHKGFSKSGKSRNLIKLPK